ncbi:MAG: CRISPR-associated endonuclease Cas1 [Halobacteriota archaeon]
MQLVLNTRGAFLKKKGDGFVIKNGEKSYEVAARKVESILITTSATITTDAIKCAMENNIDVVFLDHFGDPFGRVWHCKLGSTTLIRRRQLETSMKPRGLRMARGWALTKIENQARYLKELKKNHPPIQSDLHKYIEQLEQLSEKMASVGGTIDKNRGKIMGLEGSASRLYFGALARVLPEKWTFHGRSRDPAADGFNCMLNYGYGVLYSMVEKGIIVAGLDPYIGFIHVDNYNKKSFVFDLIELYRTYVDQTVVPLFTRKMVKEDMFDTVPGGFTLNADGKTLLLQLLNDAFERSINHRGRNVKIRNIIQLDCHRIANDLLLPGDE